MDYGAVCCLFTIALPDVAGTVRLYSRYSDFENPETIQKKTTENEYLQLKMLAEYFFFQKKAL